MALKLMYITNRPEVANIAEAAGVDRIFVDMEHIGKAARQGGMNTVQNHHTAEDIKAVKHAAEAAEVVVRINPIHDAAAGEPGSREEINRALAAGADLLMLPYFKTVEEVETFLNLVDGKAKVLPLVETPEAVEKIDEILKLDGIDEFFLGLNDLSLGYGKKFMFELLADGTVERLCLKFKQKGVPYGFGGIASLGKGLLPSEYVIREHYRLGSSCAILSRSFCNAEAAESLEQIERTFCQGLREIRALEEECEQHSRYFRDNEREVARRVRLICSGLR